MRKLLITIMMISIALVIMACDHGDKQIEDSSVPSHVNTQKAIELYASLSGFKGIELYVWTDEKTNNIYCGLLEGTNRNKGEEDFQLLFDNPVTVEKIHDILQEYHKDQYVFVTGIDEKVSSEMIETLKHYLVDDLKMSHVILLKADKQLTIEDFRNLQAGITEKEIIEMFGEPDGIGSGFYCNTYELENHTKVVLYFDGESKLTLVRYWSSEDEYKDIIK